MSWKTKQFKIKIFLHIIKIFIHKMNYAIHSAMIGRFEVKVSQLRSILELFINLSIAIKFLE